MNLLDLLFPKKCVGCGKSGKYFCDQCIKNIAASKPVCPYCKYYSFASRTHSRCVKKYGLDGLITVFYYRDVVREGIKLLKYNFITDLADEFVGLAINRIDKSALQLKNPVIIPIPLHKKRENWRGFNQSEALTRILSDELNWEMNTNILRRVRNTEQQARLNKKDRLRNLCGVYAVNNQILDKFSDRNLVLFDDVWTTGTTIKEACKILKKNGAKTVWGMAVAR